MTATLEKLIQHLDEHNVRYLLDRDSQAVCADFLGDAGVVRIVARVDEDDLVQVFGFAPIRIPEGCRGAVAETITRANHGLRVGKFEMDFDDGELRFQAAQIVADENLDDAVISQLIGTTIGMCDRYLPAVLSVVYANETPRDAVRQVEADVSA